MRRPASTTTARYYDPRVSQWISTDPLLNRSPEQAIETPQLLNAYAYAYQNPVRYNDPTGEIPVETIADIADVGYSAYQLWRNPSWKNAGMLAWSVGATFVPYVPGAWTARLGKTAFRGLNYAGDLARLSGFERQVASWIGRRGENIIGLGDDGVRQTLGMARNARAADFLSVDAAGRFTIREVKQSAGSAGADIGHALSQLDSTVAALQGKVRGARISNLEIVVPRGANLKGGYRLSGNQLVRVTDAGTEVVRVRGRVVRVTEIP